MTGLVGIADLILEINDEKIFYRMGTLSYDTGEPEIKVEGLAAGGGTKHIATVDASTAFGMVKVTVPVTIDTVKQVREWKANSVNGNTVRISGDDDFVLLDASLINKIEIKPGVDSEIALEFHGTKENS